MIDWYRPPDSYANRWICGVLALIFALGTGRPIKCYLLLSTMVLLKKKKTTWVCCAFICTSFILQVSLYALGVFLSSISFHLFHLPPSISTFVNTGHCIIEWSGKKIHPNKRKWMKWTLTVDSTMNDKAAGSESNLPHFCSFSPFPFLLQAFSLLGPSIPPFSPFPKESISHN